MTAYLLTHDNRILAVASPIDTRARAGVPIIEREDLEQFPNWRLRQIRSALVLEGPLERIGGIPSERFTRALDPQPRPSTRRGFISVLWRALQEIEPCTKSSVPPAKAIPAPFAQVEMFA